MVIINNSKLKSYGLTLLSLILCLKLSGQQISRYVMATGGNSYLASDLHLAYTIGQAGLAGSFTSNSYSLNIGFQQADHQIHTGIYDFDDLIKLAIYPNPFSAYFALQIEANLPGKLIYTIYDYVGRIVFQRRNINLSFSHFRQVIETGSMMPGTYFLEVMIFPVSGNLLQYAIPIICIK